MGPTSKVCRVPSVRVSCTSTLGCSTRLRLLLESVTSTRHLQCGAPRSMPQRKPGCETPPSRARRRPAPRVAAYSPDVCDVWKPDAAGLRVVGHQRVRVCACRCVLASEEGGSLLALGNGKAYVCLCMYAIYRRGRRGVWLRSDASLLTVCGLLGGRRLLSSCCTHTHMTTHTHIHIIISEGHTVTHPT